MTATVVLLLFAALLAVDLARRARGVPGEAAMAILVAAFPRALLVPAAAVTLGGWRVRRAFEAIAATGSAGVRSIADPADHLLRLALAGAIACIGLLAVGLFLVWRARAVPATVPVTPATAAGLWLRGTAVMLGCVCVGYGLIAAERAAFVSVVPYLDRAAVAPPAAYADLQRASPETRVAETGRLVQELTVGGLVICLALVVQVVSTGRNLMRGSIPGRLPSILPGAAIAMVLFAAWRSVHLSDAIGWLSGLLARIPG